MMGVIPLLLLFLRVVMATPTVTNTVNFISYNSTGLDTIKTKWVRELAETTNTSFICLLYTSDAADE